MPTIECMTDGPYVVKELDDLRDSRGAALKAKPAMALCRCGGSAGKPFCDGTHAKIGFSSARLTDGAHDRRVTYAGKAIAIHDNRGLCAHAGHCSDGLPAVFRYGQEPWIDPDAAPAAGIAATIRRCPSGALSYSEGGIEHRDLDRGAAITVTKNGPYAVVGAVELVGQRLGDGASKEHYTLCRCGASKNKPFCDGSHWSAGFEDDKN